MFGAHRVQIGHAVGRKPHRRTRRRCKKTRDELYRPTGILDRRLARYYEPLDTTTTGVRCVQRRVHAHSFVTGVRRVACPEASCMRACGLGLSRVASGPFCCPPSEQHRFDTCRKTLKPVAHCAPRGRQRAVGRISKIATDVSDVRVRKAAPTRSRGTTAKGARVRGSCLVQLSDVPRSLSVPRKSKIYFASSRCGSLGIIDRPRG